MNKKLLRSVREYKKQSVLAPVLVILEVLMEVLIPLVLHRLWRSPVKGRFHAGRGGGGDYLPLLCRSLL